MHRGRTRAPNSYKTKTGMTNLIGVDDAVEVGVGHAVAGQLEAGLDLRLLGVGAVDRVQLVERRLCCGAVIIKRCGTAAGGEKTTLKRLGFFHAKHPRQCNTPLKQIT